MNGVAAGEKLAGSVGANVVIGYPRSNISLPVSNLSEAVVFIDNRDVAIDGMWQFKGPDGVVLDEPKIIDQPADMTDRLLLAARAAGETLVSVTEKGVKKDYTIRVVERDLPVSTRPAASRMLQDTILRLANLPDLRVSVVDAQVDFLATQKSSDGKQSATPSSPLPTYQPSIILEGSVKNDLELSRALSIANRFSPNVLNFVAIEKPTQVRIKVQVVSITLNRDSNMGLQYNGGANTMNVGFGANLGLDTVGPSLFAPSYPFFRVRNLNNGHDLRAVLNLGQTDTKIKVLQEPTLTVLNGESATFRVGGEFPVLTRQIDSAGNVTFIPTYRPFGISLAISPIADVPSVPGGPGLLQGASASSGGSSTSSSTGSSSSPQFNFTTAGNPQSRETVPQTPSPVNSTRPTVDQNGIIRLFVRPEISTLDFSRTTDLQPAPIVNQRMVETRVALKDRESLILGGLFDDNFQQSMEKVPFIADIPVLGELFKNRRNSRQRVELVFILTPVIVGREDIIAGDYPKPRLSEMVQHLQEKGIPLMSTKPTRISAKEILVRAEDLSATSIPVTFSVPALTPREETISTSPESTSPQEKQTSVEDKTLVEAKDSIHPRVTGSDIRDAEETSDDE